MTRSRTGCYAYLPSCKGLPGLFARSRSPHNDILRALDFVLFFRRRLGTLGTGSSGEFFSFLVYASVASDGHEIQPVVFKAFPD